MSRIKFLLIACAMFAISATAQKTTEFTPAEQEMIDLSNAKWQ